MKEVFICGVQWIHFFYLLLFFKKKGGGGRCLKSFRCLQHINNSHVQKQDYKMALKKYRKALRYLDVCWEKEGIDEGELSLLSNCLFVP